MATLPRNPLPAGRRIRVLVVDDSAVIRRLIGSALEGDPDLELVGTASNGLIALQRIPQLNPDVITLDIEMPEMDGIETLRRIRVQYPTLPVIMCSTLTERGAAITIDALLAGANDYITKDVRTTERGTGLDSFRDHLLPKLKQFFRLPLAAPIASGVHAAPLKPVAAGPLLVRPPAAVAPVLPRKVLLIGVSTGGPNALGEILPAIPANYPLPILITQHMPPMFTKLFADRLNATCQIRVEEAVHGRVLEAGLALVAPGDYHLGLERFEGGVRVKLNQSPPENSCRPAVDVMFRAANEIYKGASIAVVLTGMGQDGLRGCELLKPAGACILAQDEATSVVWGMPGFVVRGGLADRVLPLGAIIPEILTETQRQKVGSV